MIINHMLSNWDDETREARQRWNFWTMRIESVPSDGSPQDDSFIYMCICIFTGCNTGTSTWPRSGSDSFPLGGILVSF